MTKDDVLQAVIAGAKANGSWDARYGEVSIKEALAQDELCSSQEPDAFDDDIEVLGHNEIRTRYRLEKGTKLYTTPPKRPWVGLTDEEIIAADMHTLRVRGDGYTYARAVEAKLKEKNT